MSAVSQYGAPGPLQIRRSLGWTYGGGQTEQLTFRGVYANVLALYNQYLTFSGYAPTMDQVRLDYERAMAVLTVDYAVDGVPQYEMVPMELSVPVWSIPYFVSDSPALTSAQLHAVRTAYETGDTATGAAFTGKQASLYAFMCQGAEEKIVSSYVLRETKNVTKRSTVAASYANVNHVDSPPNTQILNTLIGALPSGEWLKKAPSVRIYGARRWQIVTEWWWAEKWSAILYGGTGSP